MNSSGKRRLYKVTPAAFNPHSRQAVSGRGQTGEGAPDPRTRTRAGRTHVQRRPSLPVSDRSPCTELSEPECRPRPGRPRLQRGFPSPAPGDKTIRAAAADHTAPQADAGSQDLPAHRRLSVPVSTRANACPYQRTAHRVAGQARLETAEKMQPGRWTIGNLPARRRGAPDRRPLPKTSPHLFPPGPPSRFATGKWPALAPCIGPRGISLRPEGLDTPAPDNDNPASFETPMYLET